MIKWLFLVFILSLIGLYFEVKRYKKSYRYKKLKWLEKEDLLENGGE